MTTCNGLDIVHRVPVTVIDDHRVGTRQSDTHSTCLGGQEETKDRVIFLVPVNGLLPFYTDYGAVYSFVEMLPIIEVILHNIQYKRHLREDQHAMSLALQFQ